MNLRYFWRSVSLVLVLWFALFPTLSYASETVTEQTYTYDWREAERELLEYTPDINSSLYTVDKDDIANGLMQVNFYFITRNGWVTKYNSIPYSWVSPLEIPVFEFSSGISTIEDFKSSEFRDGMSFVSQLSSVDGSSIIDAGDNFKLIMNGFKHQMRYNYRWSWQQTNVGGGSGGGTAYYPLDVSKINYVAIIFTSMSGQTEEVIFQNSDISNILTTNGDTFGIDTDLVAPDFDVKHITIHMMYTGDAFNWSVPDASDYHSGANHDWGTGIYFQTNVYNGVLKIETPDKTTGLLSGIIEWLRSIRDGIVNVGSGVTNVFNSILELPSRIWTFIQEGLKMLFIPSEQDISNMHNQWDELMRDRFGAIYESGDIVHSFADTMNVNSAMVADTGGVITMPSVTANLAGTDFTFGGYEVDLVPDGFQWVVTSLKMLINIVCTILFINALKGKIEVLLR